MSSRNRFHLLLPALAAGLAVCLLAAPSAAEAPFPAGAQMTVTPYGFAPDLAPHPGGFVAVWVENGTNRVVVRLLAPDGTPRGAEVPVGLHDPFFPTGPPQVSTDAAGNFVVVWTEVRDDAPEGAILGRRFAASGAPLGPAELVSAAGPQRRFGPRIDQAPGGRYLVAWSARVAGTSRTDTFARWFEADGSPDGSAFRVNTETLREQEVSDVAVDASGERAVVVWTHNGGEGTFGEIYAALVTPGAAGPEVHVNADPEIDITNQDGGQAVQLADGTWWIVFHSVFQDGADGSIVGRRFANDLTPLTGDLVLNERPEGNQETPAVTPLPQGDGFVVAWVDFCFTTSYCPPPEFRSRDGGGEGVFGRAFAADGTPLTPDVQVPLSSAGVQRAPTLATSGADLLAAWADATLGAVHARRLEDTACPGDPDAVCLHGGRFRIEVEWTDFQGGSGEGVGTVRGSDWSSFWFFHPANVELAVKILDGRSINHHWWVFYASLTNVGFTLEVTDRQTGVTRTYTNPPRTFASAGDTLALPDPVAVPDEAAAGALEGADEAAPASADAWQGALVALPAADAGSAVLPPCEPHPTQLCLQDDDFAVQIAWRDFLGNTGVAQGEELTPDSGYFWFFRQGNPEVLVKVLDGRPVNGHYWVFFASLTNVDFDILVTRGGTSQEVRYENELRSFASRGDTTAFPPVSDQPTP